MTRAGKIALLTLIAQKTAILDGLPSRFKPMVFDHQLDSALLQIAELTAGVTPATVGADLQKQREDEMSEESRDTDPVRYLSQKILALMDDAIRITGDNKDNVAHAADVLLTAIGLSWALLRATSGQPETINEEARKLGAAAHSMQAGKPWVVAGSLADPVFARLSDFPRYVFECDDATWVLTVHGDVCVWIAHEGHSDDGDGWEVEVTKVDGRWEIYDGAAELAANTRATTPAALEELLNLHWTGS